MNRFLLIPSALLALILFSGKSCDDGSEELRHQQEEEAAVKEIDHIKSRFGGDYLNDESLFAFEMKAIQKLVDYADYFNIANDTSLDSVFRKQAASMITDLFCDGNVPQTLVNMTGKIRIDSIRIIEPLHQNTDLFYTGTLGFILEFRDDPDSNAASSISHKGMIEMVAMKSDQPSGTDTLRIWKVFLGEYRDERLFRLPDWEAGYLLRQSYSDKPMPE
jgi:hypothetical protein